MGCWTLGGAGWGAVDTEAAIRTIHAAVDGGVNWVDTAPLYGQADTIVAHALRGRSTLVATKVGAAVINGHAISDLSAAHIRADCEASLVRLGRTHIDLLQIHWPCERGTPLAETFAALMALKAAGMVRHIGVCNYGPAALAEIRTIAPIVSLQTPYSLLRREFERGLRDASRGVSVLAYEGLCRGLLTSKYRNRPVFPANDIRANDPRFSGARFHHAVRLSAALAQVGDRVGVSAAAVALGWVLTQPGVTAVVAGARSARQATENLEAAQLLGRPRLWRVLEQILQRHGPPPP